MRIGSVIGLLILVDRGTASLARWPAAADSGNHGVVQIAVGDHDAPVAGHQAPGAEIELAPIDIRDAPASLVHNRIPGDMIPHLLDVPFVRREAHEEISLTGGDHGVLVLAVELALGRVRAAT